MRKYISKFISLILAVVLVCSIGMVSAYAANTPFEGHISGSGVNFRKGPSTSYAIRGVYSYGTVVTVLEELENGWCRVNILGVEGFVYGAYVTRGYSPQTPIALDTSLQGQWGFVNTNNVNLRYGPGSGYASLGALLKGTDVLILSYLSNGWYGVQVNGYPGFIFGDFVTVGTYNPADEFITSWAYTGVNPMYCNIGGVVVRSAPSSNASAIGTLPVYVEVNVLTEYSNGWYGISYQSLNGALLTGYVYSYNLDDQVTIIDDVVPVRTPVTEYTAYIIKDKAEWRTGPGTEFPIAMYFKLKDAVTVTAEYANKDGVVIWYEVKYNGMGPGCVYVGYVSTDINDIPSNSQPVTYTDLNVPGIITTDNTPAYSIAANGQVIGYLAYGTPLTVNREFSNGWLLVTIAAGPCYVYKTGVTY